jgi:DNA-binding response OmpR family regulator
MLKQVRRVMLAQVLLSFGYDKMMLLTRSMVLRTAGYKVEEVSHWHDAFSRAQADVIDAMVLCHTVPLREQESLLTAIRAIRRLLPVFCVVHQVVLDTCIEGCIAIDSDPEELLSGLQSALRQVRTTA